jgi:altronate dehydratase small subunit
MKGQAVSDSFMIMHADDTVATALTTLEAGRTVEVDGRTVSMSEEIPFGHKFALKSMAIGDDVIKYGEVIGRAVESVSAGDWVHVHNVESIRARPDSPSDETDAAPNSEGSS